MSDAYPFRRALEPAHRADPYPFYAALPPVPARLEDGRYVVRDYDQVLSLLHDPRLSSAGERGSAAHPADSGAPKGAGALEGTAPRPGPRSLLQLDPPEHDRLRRIMMRQFGPPHRPRLVAELEDEITARSSAASR